MKVLAFDLGGVIFGFDYNIAYQRIKSRIKVSWDNLLKELFYSDFTADFDKGVISSFEFYLKFKDAFSGSLNYEDFSYSWCNIFYPMEEVISLIEGLKKIYPVYLISNINELHFDYLYSLRKEVFSLFDDLILSYKVNSIKPEEKIYQALSKASGSEFKDIVYIDDRQDLICAAEKLGLRGIRFVNFSQLKSDLKSLGVTIS